MIRQVRHGRCAQPKLEKALVFCIREILAPLQVRQAIFSTHRKSSCTQASETANQGEGSQLFPRALSRGGFVNYYRCSKLLDVGPDTGNP